MRKLDLIFYLCVVKRNEQYYEAILSIWNQLYINVKSLIAWQYCLLDIKRINSLTISMVSDEEILTSVFDVLDEYIHVFFFYLILK